MMIDVKFSRANPEGIARTIKDHGIVILRGALNKGWVRRVKANTRTIFARQAALAAGSKGAERFFSGCLEYDVERVETGNILTRLYEQLYGNGNASAFQPFHASQLTPIYDAFFGGPYHDQDRNTLSDTNANGAAKTTLGIDFHTDGAHYDDEHLALTLWIPLDRCGRDAPGLWLVDAGKDEAREYLAFDETAAPSGDAAGPPNAHKYKMSRFRETEIRDHFGERLLAPKFGIGDLVLFSNWTIHATRRDPSMTKTRGCIQLRLIGDGPSQL